MLRAIFILVVALLALPVPLAAQQLSPDWIRCINKGSAFSPDVAIGGCTKVLQSRKDDAVRLLRLVTADCPRDFVEFLAARQELKLLGAET